MVRVTDELALSPEHVTLYHAHDPLLGHLPVLVFHGPSTTANYTLNSSRIQIHVLSPAGFLSFPRITISPNSPFYGVVNHLPREFQGDEICRGLAFGLFKYFNDLPEAVKNHLRAQYPVSRGRRPGSAPVQFGEQHAADLAKSMAKADNTPDVVRTLHSALQAQHISNVDLDLVLPPGSITPLRPQDLEDVPEDEDDIIDPTLRQYAMYTPIIKLLGEPVFLPTSKLRRAPSKPSSLSRSKSFCKDQKVELRMKMGELVDTEERYVLKLNELVKHVADEFRQKAKDRQPGSISPTADEIDRLFPRSADRILQINSAFMQALRKVMDDTEDDAVKDFDVPFTGSRIGGSLRQKDPSGALAMARVFLEWFPKFTDCYQDYIRASQHFPQLLNSFLDSQSSFRDRVAQKGEQAIRSILIEPVQRLPRYSLFIDQIVGCLPITHPALQVMLKARDIITNICSMDDPLQDKPHVTNRLRNMVECWPLDLEPQGRLILSADFLELAAPYYYHHHAEPQKSLAAQDRAGIFLLFSDCLVVVKKKPGSALTGRDLLREIDKPSPAGLLASMTNAAGGAGSYDFAFTGWHSLADVRFTESADGRLVWMTSTQDMKGGHSGEYVTSKAATSRCFVLLESFDAKAQRWTEDVVKARIEGRFAEAEREDPTWTLRSVRMPDSNMGLHAAVFHEAAEQLIDGRKEPAAVRVVLDNDKGTKSAPVGHYGVEIVVEVKTTPGLRMLSMNTLGLNGKRYTDDIALDDFLPTLSRRIIQLLTSQSNASNIRLTPGLVSYYTKILRSLSFTSRAEKTRSFLAASPVKQLLSNFLSGGTMTMSTDNTTASASASAAAAAAAAAPKHQRTPLGNVSTLFPPPLHRSGSRQEITSLHGSARGRDGPPRPGADDDDRPENPLVRLEQTFTGYVAALQSRKGQFVGRTLLNRSAADELTVNDLYNRLIESPFEWDLSPDVGAEIIFAAFEKFTRIAWADQMGPVMTAKSLDALQERASRRVPGDFGDFVNYIFSDMAPQNRRAFTALVKLLADLLDGCGNDSDRGALTLAFADLLVAGHAGSPPHNYINLLDRLVEDCDRIFLDDGPGPGTASATATAAGPGFGSSVNLAGSAYESMNSTTRSTGHKSTSGSVTSSTSSLRRKLGFDTLLRQNSKTATDAAERPSMWRSLSKHTRHPAVAAGESSSLSKASVNRSRSVDMGLQQQQQHPPGPNKLRRAPSRDRPPLAGAFDETTTTPRPSSSHHRPTSSHRLETIGEPDVEHHHQQPASEKTPLKNRRRSSLSDLKSLMAAASLEDHDHDHPPPPVPLSVTKPTSEKFNSSPRVPSPSKIPISPQTSSLVRSPHLKENAVEPPLSSSRTETSKPGHAKTLSNTQIPTLRLPRNGPSNPTGAGGGGGGGGGASPSHRSANAATTPSTTAVGTSPSKAATTAPAGPRLRLQSPQKLRERLQTEMKAVDSVDASLKSELSRISQDMARVNACLPRSATADVEKIAARVQALEERIPQLMAGLAEKQAAIRRDMEGTLKASEAKLKAIDQLYKEATAENELLYEKFNSELGKIVKALKGKGREDKEELVSKLKGQSEETARVKKENARLKREMVSLRTLAKGGGD